MRYERVKVTRDTNTVHSREVAPWEIPVLEFIFEDGNVVRTGEFVEPTAGTLINLDYPEASTELKRLIDAYGHDPKSGVPYAVSVYGNARAGVNALQKLIDEAKVVDAAAGKRKVLTPASVLKRGKAARGAVDALLS